MRCSNIYLNSIGDGNGNCVCNGTYVGSPSTGCYICSNRDWNSEPKDDRSGCKCKHGFALALLQGAFKETCQIDCALTDPNSEINPQNAVCTCKPGHVSLLLKGASKATCHVNCVLNKPHF